MKRSLYYVLYFLVIFVSFLICDIIDGTNLPILLIILFLAAITAANLTPTSKSFDYIIIALTPISLYSALFVCLFFDEGCDGTPQLSFHHALNVEYYKAWLPMSIAITAVAFIASFKYIRLLKIRKNHKT